MKVLVATENLLQQLLLKVSRKKLKVQAMNLSCLRNIQKRLSYWMQ